MSAPDADLVLAKTQEYLAVPAVVGHEEPFLARLAADLGGLGCSVERSGGVLAAWGHPEDGRLLSCHIDRHGLVGTGDGEYEYAAYVARLARGEEGFKSTRASLERICDRFLREEVTAYVSADGASLATGVIEHAYFCERRLNLVFRIAGFDDLPIGTPVAFSRPCEVAEESLTGQLDNGVSAAVAYALFAAGYSGRALFTPEEEIGRSWRLALDYLAEHDLAPQELLVLDTSPFPDASPFPDEDPVRRGAVVLRRRDANGAFNGALVDRLESACAAAGIPYVVKDAWIAAENARRRSRGERESGLGSTELGRMVAASAGAVTGATVQLPTAGYHSNRETTSRRAVANLLRLLATA